jgi:hypothetical protein
MLTENKYRTTSLKEFTITYEQALKKSAPVRTGRLRDSIVVESSGVSDAFDIVTYAVYYAVYVNNSTGFITKNDYLIEDYATIYAEALWDDFAKQLMEL